VTAALDLTVDCRVCGGSIGYVAGAVTQAQLDACCWLRVHSECADDAEDLAPLSADPATDAIDDVLAEERDDEADLEAYTAQLDRKPTDEEARVWLCALAKAREGRREQRRWDTDPADYETPLRDAAVI
jgi:hypothetical protein